MQTFTSNFLTALSAALAAGDTSISLVSTERMPEVDPSQQLYCFLLIEHDAYYDLTYSGGFELVRVFDVNPDGSFLVQRGIETVGTPPPGHYDIANPGDVSKWSWPAGSRVGFKITGAVLEELGAIKPSYDVLGVIRAGAAVPTRDYGDLWSEDLNVVMKWDDTQLKYVASGAIQADVTIIPVDANYDLSATIAQAGVTLVVTAANVAITLPDGAALDTAGVRILGGEFGAVVRTNIGEAGIVENGDPSKINSFIHVGKQSLAQLSILPAVVLGSKLWTSHRPLRHDKPTLQVTPDGTEPLAVADVEYVDTAIQDALAALPPPGDAQSAIILPVYGNTAAATASSNYVYVCGSKPPLNYTPPSRTDHLSVQIINLQGTATIIVTNIITNQTQTLTVVGSNPPASPFLTVQSSVLFADGDFYIIKTANSQPMLGSGARLSGIFRAATPTIGLACAEPVVYPANVGMVIRCLGPLGTGASIDLYASGTLPTGFQSTVSFNTTTKEALVLRGAPMTSTSTFSCTVDPYDEWNSVFDILPKTSTVSGNTATYPVIVNLIPK